MEHKPVPFSIIPKAEDELKKMEKDGIVEEVSNAVWATSIMLVTGKQGTIRICTDYKIIINKHLKDKKYPIHTTLEEIFS